ncbi:hypothetical protein PWG71_21150 [Nocardiopsis sp. N85]|uniref:hypothetical protein n=1 Tax=Nocardiopsis sp. N85 TaxID=3029400 RepID=UPI00237F7587|nr:hypothetical protein [Nocardiopsis sp. N85]MDE3723906.1 hypothetical protein [Nocardiopsis sp. N85]
MVGPPRPADPAVVNVWGEEEPTNPDAEETDVFLVLGADRRARVEKKKEEEEGEEEPRAEAEELRIGPPAPDPASESEGSLLYRGVSLFAPEAGERPLGAATADEAPEGGPVDAAGSVDAVSVVPRDRYRAPETEESLPASGGTDGATGTSAEKPAGLPAEHFDTDVTPAASDAPERPAGVAGLGTAASVAPVDEGADTPSVEPAATADDPRSAGWTGGHGLAAPEGRGEPGTGVPGDRGVGGASVDADDTAGASAPAARSNDLGSVESGEHEVPAAGGADRGLGVFSGGDLGRMPPPGYATADAASAFLTGRVAGTGFSPAYAAPGGYEQRIAAVKPVPVSVWRRAVFTVTRGRVNPG